jgi:hypothetical protein
MSELKKNVFLKDIEKNTKYHQITFGGCGFLLSYYFGAILCLLDNGITVDNAVGISGGCMAALAMLGGRYFEKLLFLILLILLLLLLLLL